MVLILVTKKKVVVKGIVIDELFTHLSVLLDEFFLFIDTSSRIYFRKSDDFLFYMMKLKMK